MALHMFCFLKRYLRVVEEIQRVELQDLSREEKLALFINLHNMMTIHAILLWGYPIGAMERRKMPGGFKYIIGGYTYLLSSIQNRILRCNQRFCIISPSPLVGRTHVSRFSVDFGKNEGGVVKHAANELLTTI